MSLRPCFIPAPSLPLLLLLWVRCGAKPTIFVCGSKLRTPSQGFTVYRFRTNIATQNSPYFSKKKKNTLSFAGGDNCPLLAPRYVRPWGSWTPRIGARKLPLSPTICSISYYPPPILSRILPLTLPSSALEDVRTNGSFSFKQSQDPTFGAFIISRDIPLRKGSISRHFEIQFNFENSKVHLADFRSCIILSTFTPMNLTGFTFLK